MGFLRRLLGGDGDVREPSPEDERAAMPEASDAEASRAEPAPGLLGDLPWVPAARVASVVAILSAPLSASLLGVPEETFRAWTAESEPVPDEALARLAFLEELIGRLGGHHDELGVRRWFDRPRQELAGKAPREMLVGAWSPEDRALVDTLIGLTGTGGVPTG